MTPSTPEITTTRAATSKVTISTSSSANSAQAAAYHFPVHAAGSQVPSQRVPNELTTTLAINASRLATKNPVTTQMTVDHSRNHKRLSWIMVHSSFPAGGRAMVGEAAQPEDARHDGELDRAHDHGDRRGH